MNNETIYNLFINVILRTYNFVYIKLVASQCFEFESKKQRSGERRAWLRAPNKGTEVALVN